MLICREFDGGVEWSKVREAIDSGLDEAGQAGERPDPDRWGLEPEHVAAQERLMRGGLAGDR